jgi:hypothetical protein
MVRRWSEAAIEINAREFLALGRFMAHGEPTHFELAPASLLDDSTNDRQPTRPGRKWPFLHHEKQSKRR